MVQIEDGERIVGTVENGGVGFLTIIHKKYNEYFNENEYIKIEKYKGNFANRFLKKSFSFPALMVILLLSFFYKFNLDNTLLSVGIQNKQNISLDFIGDFFFSYFMLIIFISIIIAIVEVFRDKLYNVVGNYYSVNLHGIYEKNKPLFIFEDIVNIRAVNNNIIAYPKNDVTKNIVVKLQNDYDTFKILDMWETYQFNKQEKQQDKN